MIFFGRGFEMRKKGKEEKREKEKKRRIKRIIN